MIGFFPAPYPEELFYSMCARYGKRLRYRNKRYLTEDLFGRFAASAIIDFPSHLDKFVSRLPPGHNFSSDEIINKNTLLPFFEPFIPFNRIELIKEDMKGAGGRKLLDRIGIRVKQVQPLTYLRYCPDCVIKDRKVYGETYWHRLPQLAGIHVCPEHQCFFADTTIKFGREAASIFSAADDIIKISEPKYIDFAVKSHQILLKMAKDAMWLLSQNKITLGLEIIPIQYHNALLKRGLAYYSGKIKSSEFIDAFENYFTSDLLIFVGRISKDMGWITKLIVIRKMEKTFHPIRHLLLLAFLEISAEDFFFNFEEFKPFGSSPYPCLNSASNHFGKLLISECDIRTNFNGGVKTRNLPLGIFSCSCGFVYRRVGPDQSEKDKFKFNSVFKYGAVWENQLSEYWQNSELSFEKIGIKLKTDWRGVIRQAIRLGLPEKFPNARKIKSYENYENFRKTFSELLSEHRKKWLSVLKNNPKFTRLELKDKANSQYTWLKRNDTYWLEKHLPPVSKVSRKKEILDWKKIDRDLYKQVKKIILKIRNEKYPMRVSLAEITRRVDNKKWIRGREQKLPLMTKLIKESLESPEEFGIKKIQYVQNLYLEEKIIPTRRQFEIRAAVKDTNYKNTKRIQEEIDKSLKLIMKI